MQQTPMTHSTLVVPVDGSDLSERAIPYAAALGGPGATLHLLRVAPNAEAIQGLWGGVVATEAQVEESTQAEAEQDIDRARVVPVPAGVAVVADVVTGDPADQIIQAGIRLHADLIVMASHGRGAMGRWTFGSVADRVARESLVPVAIIRAAEEIPADGATVRRIVVPLDGSELSRRALPVAADLARRLLVPVILLQVINPATGYYPILAAGAVAADEAYAMEFANEELGAARNLDECAASLRHTGIEVTTRIQVGPTIPAIESVLEPGDVVVITSHGRSGIRRWLLGSVAERLVRNATAPVVLVPAVERQQVTREAPVMFAAAPSIAD